MDSTDPVADTLTLQASWDQLAQAGAWAAKVAERLGLPGSMLFAIQLCLEEAVSNIVRHGAQPGSAVHLAIRRAADAVLLTVQDRGPAFDPRQIAAPVAPTSIDEAEVGGLGIQLMRQFAQAMDYQRVGDANRLSLRFDLAKDRG
jgi:anti-sigma regulatory factor (Ser/Thr protein kinase)